MFGTYTVPPCKPLQPPPGRRRALADAPNRGGGSPEVPAEGRLAGVHGLGDVSGATHHGNASAGLEDPLSLYMFRYIHMYLNRDVFCTYIMYNNMYTHVCIFVYIYMYVYVYMNMYTYMCSI